MKTFEVYFMKEVVARLLQFEQVIDCTIIKIMQTTSEAPQAINGVQVLVETKFETMEDLTAVIQAEEGMEMMEAVANVPSGFCSSFISKEIVLNRESFKEYVGNFGK